MNRYHWSDRIEHHLLPTPLIKPQSVLRLGRLVACTTVLTTKLGRRRIWADRLRGFLLSHPNRLQGYPIGPLVAYMPMSQIFVAQIISTISSLFSAPNHVLIYSRTIGTILRTHVACPTLIQVHLTPGACPLDRMPSGVECALVSPK